jgi:hypothetical protein
VSANHANRDTLPRSGGGGLGYGTGTSLQTFSNITEGSSGAGVTTKAMVTIVSQ